MSKRVFTKKSLITLFLLLLCSCVFAEVIVLNDGSVLKGQITSMDEETLTIKTEFGIMDVSREKVNQIYKNEAEYEKTKSNTTTDTASEILKDIKKESDKEKAMNKELIKVNTLFVWGAWGVSSRFMFLKNGNRLTGKQAVLDAMEGVEEAQNMYNKYWNYMAAGYANMWVGLGLMCLTPLILIPFIDPPESMERAYGEIDAIFVGLGAWTGVFLLTCVQTFVGMGVAHVYSRKRIDAVNIYNDAVKRRFTRTDEEKPKIQFAFSPTLTFDKDLNPHTGLIFQLRI